MKENYTVKILSAFPMPLYSALYQARGVIISFIPTWFLSHQSPRISAKGGELVGNSVLDASSDGFSLPSASSLSTGLLSGNSFGSIDSLLLVPSI